MTKVYQSDEHIEAKHILQVIVIAEWAQICLIKHVETLNMSTMGMYCKYLPPWNGMQTRPYIIQLNATVYLQTHRCKDLQLATVTLYNIYK